MFVIKILNILLIIMIIKILKILEQKNINLLPVLNKNKTLKEVLDFR